jgi:hypothetical protein
MASLKRSASRSAEGIPREVYHPPWAFAGCLPVFWAILFGVYGDHAV